MRVFRIDARLLELERLSDEWVFSRPSPTTRKADACASSARYTFNPFGTIGIDRSLSPVAA